MSGSLLITNHPKLDTPKCDVLWLNYGNATMLITENETLLIVLMHFWNSPKIKIITISKL